MSTIVKTEAIVLNKINFGDSSLIFSLYTKEYGKISAIIKGAKDNKSKAGKQADLLNHLNIVFYKKDTRDIQLISSVDVISHFPGIKTDLEKLKHAYALVELVNYLLPEEEANEKLFRGIVRILELLNSSDERENIIFLRFFMFLLKETGYELQIETCTRCGKAIPPAMELSYNYDNGIFCNECKSDNYIDYRISTELFALLICLKKNLNSRNFNDDVINEAIGFFERYLKHHIQDFPGIRSLKNLKI